MKAAWNPATPVGEIIAHGEADFGCQQRSELQPVKGIDIVGLIPQEVQLKTEFSAAVVRGSRHPDAARALLRFLAAPANAAAVEATGLIQATGDKAAPGYWMAGAAAISLLATLLVYRGIVRERPVAH